MGDAADRLEAARRAWPWPARDTPATDEVPLSMWPAYELIDALEARVREMEATLRQMHEEAKRDEVTQAPTASVYKAYRLAQQRETIEAVAERLGVSLAAVEKRPTRGDQDWIDRANAARWLAAVSAEKEGNSE